MEIDGGKLHAWHMGTFTGGKKKSKNTHVQNGLDRRTVLKAAAWSVPVVSVAVATPLAAASGPVLTCPLLTTAQFSAWNANVTGQIGDAGTGTNTANGWGATVYWAGPAFPSNGSGFLSIENNLARNTTDETPLASFTIESFVTVEPGLQYQLSFSALGDYANKSADADRRYQQVEFLVDDVVVWADATEAVNGLPGNLTIAHGPVDVVYPTSGLTTVPAGVTTVKIAFRFTLPAKPTNAQRAANDDIVISLPQFICANADF